MAKRGEQKKGRKPRAVWSTLANKRRNNIIRQAGLNQYHRTKKWKPV